MEWKYFSLGRLKFWLIKFDERQVFLFDDRTATLEKVIEEKTIVDNLPLFFL